jgi:DNA anti-recombination protein RmuC
MLSGLVRYGTREDLLTNANIYVYYASIVKRPQDAALQLGPPGRAYRDPNSGANLQEYLVYQPSANYFEVVQETATMIANQLSESNTRTLNYVKGLWSIAGRSNGDSMLKSAFERAEAVVSLTAKELEESLQTGYEFTEKLLAQGKKLQATSYESAREYADKALANAKQVVEAANERIETFTDKVTESIDEASTEVKKKKVTAAAE